MSFIVFFNEGFNDFRSVLDGEMKSIQSLGIGSKEGRAFN